MLHVDCLSRSYTFVIDVSEDPIHDNLLILQDQDKEILNLKKQVELDPNKHADYSIINGKLMKRSNGKLLYLVPR